MASLQNICIDNLVKKGHPDSLSFLPPILYQLVTERIKATYFPHWTINIGLVHLELLITSNKLIFETQVVVGEIIFIYSLLEGGNNSTFRLHENVYHLFDVPERVLFDNTIEYLKFKGLYDDIQREANAGENLFRRSKRLKIR